MINYFVYKSILPGTPFNIKPQFSFPRAVRSFNFSLRLWIIRPGFYILNAIHFQESFNNSFKLGSSITLDSRWWTKCSYGKEVYTSGYNDKGMFQALFTYKDLGLR